ncbi:hypothetical protein [Segeticoccus rhizosphaerae]|uniref:hypothetical protein n=1 Tax=Segeticoccus rhizosphaerae TaxID=1104777 RepID=UPI0012643C20|nr:hypothetical protein [Segeticoccus rhizosphaerae]
MATQRCSVAGGHSSTAAPGRERGRDAPEVAFEGGAGKSPPGSSTGQKPVGPITARSSTLLPSGPGSAYPANSMMPDSETKTATRMVENGPPRQIDLD